MSMLTTQVYRSFVVIRRHLVRSQPGVPASCSGGRGYQRLAHFQGAQTLEVVVEVGAPVFEGARAHWADREAVKVSRVSDRCE